MSHKHADLNSTATPGPKYEYDNVVGYVRVVSPCSSEDSMIFGEKAGLGTSLFALACDSFLLSCVLVVLHWVIISGFVAVLIRCFIASYIASHYSDFCGYQVQAHTYTHTHFRIHTHIQKYILLLHSTR